MHFLDVNKIMMRLIYYLMTIPRFIRNQPFSRVRRVLKWIFYLKKYEKIAERRCKGEAGIGSLEHYCKPSGSVISRSE